jgi:CubicO group peptidase (beta-lactamase class C family)
MLLGNDYQSSALGFRLDHEPGGFYNVSPANLQLVAVVLERTTGKPYERFIDERLWSAVHAGRAEMQLDRRAGMPAAHCCWRATARDMLRIATLLSTDGRHDERPVLPSGWVEEMARPSRVNAETGLQLRRLRLEGHEALAASDDAGSEFWVVGARELVVLSIAGRSGRPQDELPALLLRSLAED